METIGLTRNDDGWYLSCMIVGKYDVTVAFLLYITSPCDRLVVLNSHLDVMNITALHIGPILDDRLKEKLLKP